MLHNVPIIMNLINFTRKIMFTSVTSYICMIYCTWYLIDMWKGAQSTPVVYASG